MYAEQYLNSSSAMIRYTEDEIMKSETSLYSIYIPTINQSTVIQQIKAPKASIMNYTPPPLNYR